MLCCHRVCTWYGGWYMVGWSPWIFNTFKQQSSLMLHHAIVWRRCLYRMLIQNTTCDKNIALRNFKYTWLYLDMEIIKFTTKLVKVVNRNTAYLVVELISHIYSRDRMCHVSHIFSCITNSCDAYHNHRGRFCQKRLPCRPQMGPMLSPWTLLSGQLN